MTMGFLYDCLYLILFILCAPLLFFKRKLHRGYRIRFGLIPHGVAERLRQKKNIWFHAVSVGEVLALADLIKKIKQEYPQYQIVLSTVTKTGHVMARQQFPDDTVLFAPMDLGIVIRQFIRLIDPKVYIAAETEIWPNLYRNLYRKNVPIIQVNGRISDQSYKGYMRFKKLWKRMLKKVSVFCMQSDLDASRIIEIGADKDKVKVTGNIKFDCLPGHADIDKRRLGFDPADRLLMAGSTHANEEEILLKVFNKLKGIDRSLRLVISPRNVDRATEIKELIGRGGDEAVLLSALNGRPLGQQHVLIVDQIGVLKDLYSIADYVFIGKTLAVGGGQNMIEPAFFGKPTIVGPMTYNFKDVVRIFLAEKALIQVEDEQGLLSELTALISDTQRAKKLGQCAADVVRKYQGATGRTLNYIRPIIERTS